MRPLLLAATLAFCGCLHTAPADPVAASGVPFLPRAEWGAEPPAGPMQAQTPTWITIHHTATLQNDARTPAEKVRALQAFSQRADTLGNGRPKVAWADIPYHFYIASDGTVVEGRDVGFEGDSNTAYDLAGHVQIVVEGNFEEETPTALQMDHLKRLTAALAVRWDVPAERVASHLDRAAPGATLCPGAALYAQLDDVRDAVRAARQTR